MSHRIGTWANKLGVRGNSNQSPDYTYWNHFRIVATVAPEWCTAVFSTWLDNRMVLIGERRPDAGQCRVMLGRISHLRPCATRQSVLARSVIAPALLQ